MRPLIVRRMRYNSHLTEFKCRKCKNAFNFWGDSCGGFGLIRQNDGKLEIPQKI